MGDISLGSLMPVAVISQVQLMKTWHGEVLPARLVWSSSFNTENLYLVKNLPALVDRLLSVKYLPEH